jgi:hypothetical protein
VIPLVNITITAPPPPPINGLDYWTPHYEAGIGWYLVHRSGLILDCVWCTEKEAADWVCAEYLKPIPQWLHRALVGLSR